MDQFAKETLPISLEDEMRRSYLDYAMSVIVGRALPDARDGLKPVHRRVCSRCTNLSNDWNKAYKKSARIVGDVIGKYHPHGDTAVYDTIVRMAQDFSLRYMLVDGQGNFGSVDGDNAAAMRYTEVRMARIGHELLADLDKETVDFGPNYDGSEQSRWSAGAHSEPADQRLVRHRGRHGDQHPAAQPERGGRCLSGAAQQPGVDDRRTDRIIPAPDFPTAGIIYGVMGVREGYKHRAWPRGHARRTIHFEDIGKGGRQAIIIDEIPYQVNKRTLLEKIAELVNEKKIEGISDLRDESDKSGMRVVIELKRGEVGEVVLNNLYKQTQLQDTFGMNMVALVDGQPRLLNLKQMLECFLWHRREVVTRRTVFELRKARERGHILEGLAVALSNVDEIIALIKASPTPADAKRGLMASAMDAADGGRGCWSRGARRLRPEGLAPGIRSFRLNGIGSRRRRRRRSWSCACSA
jgi:DNA gyrase subunit A